MQRTELANLIVKQVREPDLRCFLTSPEPALFIDVGPKAISENLARTLTYCLPTTYKIHFKGRHISVVVEELAASLSEHVPQAVLDPFMEEVTFCLHLFRELTNDETPLVSLRVVDEEYVKKEHPSVSNLYHRDASAITLTKCFFGEGVIYLDNDNVRREFFETESIALSDDLAAINPDDYHITPDGSWVLLKGEMYNGMDARNMSVVNFVLGKDAQFSDYGKGRGLIHKGGRFTKSDRRLVFTVSTYKTEF